MCGIRQLQCFTRRCAPLQALDDRRCVIEPGRDTARPGRQHALTSTQWRGASKNRTKRTPGTLWRCIGGGSRPGCNGDSGAEEGDGFLPSSVSMNGSIPGYSNKRLVRVTTNNHASVSTGPGVPPCLGCFRHVPALGSRYITRKGQGKRREKYPLRPIHSRTRKKHVLRTAHQRATANSGVLAAICNVGLLLALSLSLEAQRRLHHGRI
ncbi:hypothetical protein V8C86DRAFT_1525930 [Haematococcus lacustris]